jgi:hypothetical protein
MVPKVVGSREGLQLYIVTIMPSLTVYRVTQKDLYLRPYTAVWAPDLRQRIIEAVDLITPHMLINTWQELEYGLDICRATTGAHTEVY